MVIYSGVNLNLLPHWHKLRMRGMAYIPLPADVFRRMSSLERRLCKFSRVFENVVAIYLPRLFIQGVSPRSNFANLGAIFKRKCAVL